MLGEVTAAGVEFEYPPATPLWERQRRRRSQLRESHMSKYLFNWLKADILIAPRVYRKTETFSYFCSLFFGYRRSMAFCWGCFSINISEVPLPLFPRKSVSTATSPRPLEKRVSRHVHVHEANWCRRGAGELFFHSRVWEAFA